MDTDNAKKIALEKFEGRMTSTFGPSWSAELTEMNSSVENISERFKPPYE